MAELPTGTVTFLFTDIEGSTRLLHELGAERYADALAEHRRLLRHAFARHGGVEVDTQGDAFFVAFDTAAGALAAATDAQAALEGGPIRVRMGIHSGVPTRTDEGYVGVEVHLAARVCAAAHGGQVLLSEGTRVLLDGRFALRDLGLHRLKDLGEPLKLHQLGDDEFPPLRSLNATNLPAQPGPLIGRDRELAELVGLAAERRLVTLTGPGGSGKTRLALQVAAELVLEFVDGVFWVPLQALRDPRLVLSTVGRAVGAPDGLADHLDEKQILLLLDNLEQLLDAAPELAELLSRCPNLHVLGTSRAPLRVWDEREYEVAPLAEPDAVALFRERAAVSEPADAVAEICRRLDGLPLAIELAAARTRILPPGQLLERLGRRLPLLTGGARDAPERQRTLRATIEWSYDLLSPEERPLFRRLAVFAGGFTVEAAEAVAGADLDTLESLVEKSLVRRWESGRLGMLETIREFALEQLDDETRRRHAEYFRTLVEGANLRTDSEGGERLNVVAWEIDNVRAALTWALQCKEAAFGLELAEALELFWAARAPFEGMRWLRALLECGEAPLGTRARALRAVGGAANPAGEGEVAERAYEESYEAFRAAGDELGAATVEHRLGASALYRGDLETARMYLESSVATLRRLGHRKCEAGALGSLGQLEFAAGNSDRALDLIERSAAMSEEVGASWWQARMLTFLAIYAFELGRLDEAAAAARRALPLTLALGDRLNTLYALANLARTELRRGRDERAGVLWGAVEAEEERGRVGAWEDERPKYAEPFLVAKGEAVKCAREHGRTLTLAEAVEAALDG